MRRPVALAALAVPGLLLLTACQRPEVEAFTQHPRPVVVACTVRPEAPGSKDFAATMEAALRVRLASRVMVVSEGVTPPRTRCAWRWTSSARASSSTAATRVRWAWASALRWAC